MKSLPTSKADLAKLKAELDAKLSEMKAGRNMDEIMDRIEVRMMSLQCQVAYGFQQLIERDDEMKAELLRAFQVPPDMVDATNPILPSGERPPQN